MPAFSAIASMRCILAWRAISMSLSGFFGSWAMLISRLALAGVDWTLTWRVETYSHRNENIFLRSGFDGVSNRSEGDRGTVLNTTCRRIDDRYLIGMPTACPKQSQDVSSSRRAGACLFAEGTRLSSQHCDFRRAV